MPPLLAVGLPGDVETWIVLTALLAGAVGVWLGARSARRAAAETEAAERRAQSEKQRADALEYELQGLRERVDGDARGEVPVLEGLPRAFRDVASSATRPAVAAQLARALERVLAPKQWMVFTAADEEGREFVLAAGGGAGRWPEGARITAQTGRLGLAVRRRQPLDVRELHAEPPIVQEQVASTEPRSFQVDVAVPLVLGERVVAVATVGGCPQSLPVVRAAALALAEHAVTVLRGLDARERAQRFAQTDPLTGLGNRNWFLATAAEELFRVRNARSIASLVLVRIRDLSAIERRHGHAASDRVLRAAAALLRPACRDGDVLARWGEDEFAMFLPGAAAADAQALAARLRETAATIRWAAAPDAAPDGIDLTAAVAAHPDRGDQLEGLLDAAVRTFGARSDAPTSSAEAPATQTVDAPAAQPAAAVTAPRESVPPPRR